MDATKPEPMPVGEGQDVGDAAAEFLRNSGHASVADDLLARIEWGAKKYGTRLKTNNGRNALMDAYQEALDGINYAMQAVIEGVSDDIPLLVFMNAAVNLRRQLDAAKV